MEIGQLSVIQSHQMQDGGMQIADVGTVSTARKPSSSVAPTAWPPFTPAPASHMLKPCQLWSRPGLSTPSLVGVRPNSQFDLIRRQGRSFGRHSQAFILRSNAMNQFAFARLLGEHNTSCDGKLPGIQTQVAFLLQRSMTGGAPVPKQRLDFCEVFDPIFSTRTTHPHGSDCDRDDPRKIGSHEHVRAPF
jgi:hypothetical protein